MPARTRRFLLVAAFLAAAQARADACSDFALQPSGNYVGTDAEGLKQVFLYTQTFFDLRAGQHRYNDAQFRAVVDEVVAEMRAQDPAAADVSARVTPRLLAARAQWAFALANRLAKRATPKHKVVVYFEPCRFDFSGLPEHMDAKNLARPHRLLLPKLVIDRSDFWARTPDPKTMKAQLVAGVDASAPLCRRADPARSRGEIRKCSGRVLLLANTGATRLRIMGLAFYGDHSNARRYDSTAIAHENNQALVDAELADAARLSYRPRYNLDWGLVTLLGHKPSSTERNDHLVQFNEFHGINYRGVQFFRDARIEDNVFVGPYAPPIGPRPTAVAQVDDFRFRQVCLSGDATSACRKPNGDPKYPYAPDETLDAIFDKPVGMGWGSGVSQTVAPAPGAATVIARNEFRTLIEGIVAERMVSGSAVERNVFDTTLDHAIYFPGAHIEGTRIAGNEFRRTLTSALKVSAHSIRSAPDALTEPHYNDPRKPLVSAYGLKDSVIEGNLFDENGQGAIFFVGTGNRVSKNRFGDSPGTGWFRRWLWPHVQNTSYGGGLIPSICGYFNHSVDNTFLDNVSLEGGSKKVEYLLGRDPRASSGGNDPTTGGDWIAGCAKYEGDDYFRLRDDREYRGIEVRGQNQMIWVTDLPSSRFGVAGVGLSLGISNTLKRCRPGESFYSCSGRGN